MHFLRLNVTFKPANVDIKNRIITKYNCAIVLVCYSALKYIFVLMEFVLGYLHRVLAVAAVGQECSLLRLVSLSSTAWLQCGCLLFIFHGHYAGLSVRLDYYCRIVMPGEVHALYTGKSCELYSDDYRH